MTGQALKAIIFKYLEEKGWRNLVPTEYYGWDAPITTPEHRSQVQHYCWHAAVAIQIAVDEGKSAKIPGGAVGPELVK